MAGAVPVRSSSMWRRTVAGPGTKFVNRAYQLSGITHNTGLKGQLAEINDDWQRRKYLDMAEFHDRNRERNAGEKEEAMIAI